MFSYHHMKYQIVIFWEIIIIKNTIKKEFKDWQGSHHDKAMQIVDSSSGLADFKGEKF